MTLLSFRNQLIFAFLIPITLIVLLGMLSMSGLTTSHRRMQTIYQDRVVPLQQLKVIADEYAVKIIDAINKANAGLQTAETTVEQIRSASDKIAEQWSQYQATRLTEREAALAAQAERLFQQANMQVADAIAALGPLAGNVQGQLQHLDGPLYQSIDPISDKIAELIQLQLDVAGTEYGLSTIAQRRGMTATVLAVVLSLTLSMLAIGFILRQVRRRLGADPLEVNRIVTEVAEGRLNVEGAAKKVHPGSVIAQLNRMVQQLASVLDSVSRSSVTVRQTSLELVEKSRVSMQASEVQQSEMQQVATAVNEMSASVSDVAGNANQASDAVREARSQVVAGRQITERTQTSVRALDDTIEASADMIQTLSEDSQKIGSVTVVIEGIAEQTNLLALNAAIEAARAGEQGRGFAVVADEVRALAQRTNESTQEIQKMIETLQSGTAKAVEAMQASRKEAQATRQQTDEALTAFESIEKAIDLVMDMNIQIAGAAEQQSAVAEEVNHNISRISAAGERTVELNSAVEQAGRSLEGLSNTLQSSIEFFRFSSK